MTRKYIGPLTNKTIEDITWADVDRMLMGYTEMAYDDELRIFVHGMR